jgi:hypothetical protein
MVSSLEYCILLSRGFMVSCITLLKLMVTWPPSFGKPTSPPVGLRNRWIASPCPNSNRSVAEAATWLMVKSDVLQILKNQSMDSLGEPLISQPGFRICLGEALHIMTCLTVQICFFFLKEMSKNMYPYRFQFTSLYWKTSI